MNNITPDIIVALGARGVLSLVGIVTLVAGVWHVDRTWDEKGSAAYKKAATDKSKAGTAGSSEKDGLLTGVAIPQSELDDAFVFPYAFIIGWIIFALAYFFPRDGSSAFVVTTPGISAAIFSLVLAIIASVPMGDAVKNRKTAKKQKLGMAFVLSWVLLTISTIFTSSTKGLTAAFCFIGAVCIIASMKILWKHRKMGDTWEQEGRPNPNPIVYNMGGPLFVFGWFLFWLGMASSEDCHETCVAGVYAPVYFTWRTFVAFLSGCGMVPVVLIVDYAHDEGGTYVGFGTDGQFFGRFLETPIPFVSAWALFGVAALMPINVDTTTVRQWIILANCILQGIVAGILIQTALYEEDMNRKNRWSVLFVLLFMALAIEIGYHGGLALALSLPGAILIILGQKTVFGDRKRGDYFMIQHEANPNPIVYSYGELYFMTGWILLSWGMSLPM